MRLTLAPYLPVSPAPAACTLLLRTIPLATVADHRGSCRWIDSNGRRVFSFSFFQKKIADDLFHQLAPFLRDITGNLAHPIHLELFQQQLRAWMRINNKAGELPCDPRTRSTSMSSPIGLASVLRS